MSIVVTLDQRASRHVQDDVARMARALNAELRRALTRKFVRTAGDEMQGIVATGSGLATAVSRCLETGGWWIGVGIGTLESPLGDTARESRGPAFWHAREALTLAHKQKGGPPGPVAVVGEPEAVAENLEAALSALAFIVTRRTSRQRAAVAAAHHTRGLLGVARQLDISVSTASHLLRAAGRDEQRRLELLTARLADEAL